MVKRLSLEKIDGLKLVPVAAIAVSTDWLKDLGITFDRCSDDMDDYEIAAFMISGTGAFALMHYENSPSSEITLMVEEKAANQTSFVPIMKCVSREFEIPSVSFHWQVDGHSRPPCPPLNDGQARQLVCIGGLHVESRSAGIASHTQMT